MGKRKRTKFEKFVSTADEHDYNFNVKIESSERKVYEKGSKYCILAMKSKVI